MAIINKYDLIKSLQACETKEEMINMLSQTKLTKTGLVVTLKIVKNYNKTGYLHQLRKQVIFDLLIEAIMEKKR